MAAVMGGVALYVGLNPALQRRVELERLAIGSVNRAQSSAVGIGGKGQGSYWAALQLAEAESAANPDTDRLPRPQLCMFLGEGREGDALRDFLLERSGVDGHLTEQLWTRVKAPLRICTTLVEASSGDATEIVEPAGTVSASEWADLLNSIRLGCSEDQPKGGIAAIGILGTMPSGVPADGYSQILRQVCGPHTKVLIDSLADVRRTLSVAADCVHAAGDHADGSASSGGVILKLNAREVLGLTGRSVKGSDSQVAADPDVVMQACMDLAAEVSAMSAGGTGVDLICFTDGPFPAGVVSVRNQRRWRLERTKALRGKVVSPIGAGDATSAGTLHAWCRDAKPGEPMSDEVVVQAFRYGFAVGAASCLHGKNAVFTMADVNEICEAISVIEC